MLFLWPSNNASSQSITFFTTAIQSERWTKMITECGKISSHTLLYNHSNSNFQKFEIQTNKFIPNNQPNVWYHDEDMLACSSSVSCWLVSAHKAFDEWISLKKQVEKKKPANVPILYARFKSIILIYVYQLTKLVPCRANFFDCSSVFVAG